MLIPPSWRRLGRYTCNHLLKTAHRLSRTYGETDVTDPGRRPAGHLRTSLQNIARFRRRSRARISSRRRRPSPPEAQKVKWPATTSVVAHGDRDPRCYRERRPSRQLDKIAFESGKSVTRETSWSNLTPARSGPNSRRPRRNANLARINFARRKGLVDEGVISRMDYDQASAEQRSREAKVGRASARPSSADHPCRHYRRPWDPAGESRSVHGCGRSDCSSSVARSYLCQLASRSRRRLGACRTEFQITARDQAGAKISGKVTALTLLWTRHP